MKKGEKFYGIIDGEVREVSFVRTEDKCGLSGFLVKRDIFYYKRNIQINRERV